MRIAFHDQTIFESAGFAFVGIDDHVFLFGLQRSGEAPFHSSREACTATTTQAGLLDFFHDLHRFHLGEGFFPGFISAGTDIFVDAFGIDDTGVAQHDAVGIVEFGAEFACRVQHQTAHGTALEEVLRHQFLNVFGLEVLIVDVFRIDGETDAASKETQRTCFQDIDLFGEVLFGQLCPECFDKILHSGIEGGVIDTYEDVTAKELHLALLYFSMISSTFSSVRSP